MKLRLILVLLFSPWEVLPMILAYGISMVIKNQKTLLQPLNLRGCYLHLVLMKGIL